METQYRGLLETAPDAMVVVNRRAEIVLLNLEAERQFGYQRDELLGQPVHNIVRGLAERLNVRDTRGTSDALAQACHTRIELAARRKDGSEFPSEIMLSGMDSAAGSFVTAAIRDISVRKLAEQNLAQMEARYRELLDAAPDAMVVVNQRGEVVLVNRQAEKQFGYQRAELVGQPVNNIIPHGLAERLIADNVRSTAGALAHEVGKGIELIALRKNGAEFPIEIMLSPLETSDGILVTAAIRDISTARAMSLMLAHSAEHDFLTGLPNRMLLNDRIAQAILNAERHSNRAALLFLDLDGFKYINDSLGHSIGDKLLQSVAQCLLACGRASDTVSRQGGDEFIVLLAEVQHADDAAIAARRVLNSVAQEHSIDQHLLHVTTSIGVSVYPDDGTDAATLIKNADTAMYQAKENGRHTYQYFKPVMNARAVERRSLEEGLRCALDLHQLDLHYQPKISFKTGAITGAEALLRWTHPTRGPVSPVQFIPIAEDCGMILPIGRWVMRKACHQLRTWLDEGLPVATMAVNVSSVEFHGRKFLDGLFAALHETHLEPTALELELTESSLLKHAKAAASILHGLRESGVQVAVDDFGTGYSSLSYLQKFPVDALKIDQSFVSNIIDAERDTTLVAAVISMAKHLRLRVIAEGVETRQQMAFLRDHKCDEAQGYYLSRPVPASEFANLVRDGILEAQ